MKGQLVQKLRADGRVVIDFGNKVKVYDAGHDHPDFAIALARPSG